MWGHFILSNAIGYKLKKEILILPPPYDNLLIKAPNNIKKGNAILYNHRLYDSYGTKEFIEFVKKNPDLLFLVTDPMINRGTDRSRYNQSPMINRLALQEMDNVKLIDGSNRLEYIQAIDFCKVAIAPYRRACVWSMAVVDCFCRGLPVIGPNFASFDEIIPDILRYESASEERLLIEKLLIEPDFWTECTSTCKLLLKRLSPSTIVEAIIYQINRIMSSDS